DIVLWRLLGVWLEAMGDNFAVTVRITDHTSLVITRHIHDHVVEHRAAVATDGRCNDTRENVRNDTVLGNPVFAHLIADQEGSYTGGFVAGLQGEKVLALNLLARQIDHTQDARSGHSPM